MKRTNLSANVVLETLSTDSIEIRVSGDLSLRYEQSVRDLERFLILCIRAGIRRIYLNCKEACFNDSAGNIILRLGALARTQLLPVQGKLTIIHLGSRLYQDLGTLIEEWNTAPFEVRPRQ